MLEPFSTPSPPLGPWRALGDSTMISLLGRQTLSHHPTVIPLEPQRLRDGFHLPAGWMRVQDTSGTYYWQPSNGDHSVGAPLGRASPSQGSSPREESQVKPTGLIVLT